MGKTPFLAAELLTVEPTSLRSGREIFQLHLKNFRLFCQFPAFRNKRQPYGGNKNEQYIDPGKDIHTDSKRILLKAVDIYL